MLVRRKQNAFTLIELLVVIAIIAILIALLVPAVQKVREAAARTQCQNNNKQIGIAMHAFHDAHKFLPPGGVTKAEPRLGINTATSHGFFVFLLPYLDQLPLSTRYSFAVNWNDATNASVIGQPLAVLNCPSVPQPLRTYTSNGQTVAACDYGPDNAINSALVGLGLIPKTADYTGVLKVNFLCRLTDITDGTSNTLTVAEDAGRPQRWEAGKLVSGTFSGAGWADRDNEYITHGYNAAGTSEPGPCAVNCTNNNEIYGFHPGGAFVTMADGSARFLSTTTPIAIVGALITRIGNETVPDSY